MLEIEGTLTVGGDILLQGEFPKMDQKLATLNSSIALKANQSDMDEMEVTLNTKANRSDLDIALSLTGEQADALNVLLGTKANLEIEDVDYICSVLKEYDPTKDSTQSTMDPGNCDL